MTGSRPQVLNDEAPRLLPSLILVFRGLKRAYECTFLLASLLQCLAYVLAATVTVTADLVYTYLQHYVRRLLYFVQNQSVFEQNACLPVGHLSKAADLKWNEFH